METWIETINQLTGGLSRGGVSTLSSATNSILNSLYPKEFELYMLSLELTTFDDSPIDYLTFPVNPDSLTKVEPKIKDISRSYGAVIVTKTDTFVPQDLVIRGNFGKSFKFLNREDSASGIVNMFKGMVPSFEGELSKYWKSGYGCLKVLQSIVQDSDKMDNGRPRRLYLHNFMLGESYLVEVLNFQMDNNVQRNMIWEYELRLKILTPINAKLTNGEKIKGGLANQVQNLGNSIAKGTKNILSGLLPV